MIVIDIPRDETARIHLPSDKNNLTKMINSGSETEKLFAEFWLARRSMAEAFQKLAYHPDVCLEEVREERADTVRLIEKMFDVYMDISGVGL